jgi:aflatoxin B1 aldehyde reductase
MHPQLSTFFKAFIATTAFNMSSSRAIVNPIIPVQSILGTMTFSSQTSKEGAIQQLQYFVESGFDTIDTARMYGKGKTEELLGEILTEYPELRAKLKIDSKVNPFKGYNENLSPENVNMQTDSILSALNCDGVNVMYLHAPDHTTPIELTLDAMQQLYEKKCFKYLGLSNYAAWQVVYIWSYCKERGYVLPTVYQGMYNPLTRDVEAELFIALDKLNIKFYAYNPLCGGLLTGKHRFEDAESSAGTRFDASNQMYLSRYWNKEYFEAINIVKEACEKEGLSLVDASFRWMLHHSGLKGSKGDAIILGGSSFEHLQQNMRSCAPSQQDRLLPDSILAAFTQAWGLTKASCVPYFR